MASPIDNDAMEGVIHCRFTFSGEQENIKMFSLFVQDLDPEYPGVCKPNNFRLCPKCNGIIWRNCSIAPKELIELAKKFDVVLRIKSFKPESRCK